jgi:hypothetical protein
MTMDPPLIRPAGLRRLTLIAGVLIALARPAPAAGATDPPASGIRVFTGDNPNFLRFHSALCDIGKRNGFQAVAYDRKWRLLVGVRPFAGFHAYPLVRGRYNGIFLSLLSPSGADYASDFTPPYHIPSGGQINFSADGGLMGGGFYPMFNEDGSDAVGVAGVLRCRYPKGKRPHRTAEPVASSPRRSPARLPLQP